MKYWAYLNDDVSQQPYSEAELKQLPNFGPDLLICSETSAVSADPDWKTVKELLPHLIRPKAPNFAKFRPKPPVPAATQQQQNQQPMQDNAASMPGVLPIPAILPAGVNAMPVAQSNQVQMQPQNQSQQNFGQNDLNKELLAQLQSLTSKITSLENKIVEQEKELAEARNQFQDDYDAPTLISEPQNEQEDDVLEVPFENDFDEVPFDVDKSSEEIAKEAEDILSNATPAEIEEYNTDDQKTELMTFGTDIQDILEDTIRQNLKKEEEAEERKSENSPDEKPFIAEDLISRTTLSFPSKNGKNTEVKKEVEEDKTETIEEEPTNDELNIDNLDELLEAQNKESETKKTEEVPAENNESELLEEQKEEVQEEEPIEQISDEEEAKEEKEENKEEPLVQPEEKKEENEEGNDVQEQPSQEEQKEEKLVSEESEQEEKQDIPQVPSLDEIPAVETEKSEEQEIQENKEEEPVEETPAEEQKEEVQEEEPVEQISEEEKKEEELPQVSSLDEIPAVETEKSEENKEDIQEENHEEDNISVSSLDNAEELKISEIDEEKPIYEPQAEQESETEEVQEGNNQENKEEEEDLSDDKEETVTIGVTISSDATTAAVLDEIAQEKSQNIQSETTPDKLFEELENTANQNKEENVDIDQIIEETTKQSIPQQNEEQNNNEEKPEQELPADELVVDQDLAKEDDFLKTFTTSVEEVFLDQPTAIISDYVPPSDNTEREPAKEISMEDIRREKPTDIKTVPLVPGTLGQEIYSSPYVESATAKLREKSKVADILKLFMVILVVILFIVLALSGLALVGVVPDTISPLHRIIYSLQKSPQEDIVEDDEIMEPEMIDDNIAAAPSEADGKAPAMTQEDMLVSTIKNYPFKDGTTLERRVLAANPNLDGDIDWSVLPTEEENVYSVAVKLPPNNAGQSFSYRFNYNTNEGLLTPTTSESQSIMQK